MRQILWFRRDLRVQDNPLLCIEGEVLPIFIFDTDILEQLEKDDRRITFIFEQVMLLKSTLQKRGLDLALFHGKPEEVFTHLLHYAPEGVYASGDYDAYALERDRRISHILPFHRLDDTYVFGPEEVLKADGTPYLVFTPYYKRAMKLFSAHHLKEHHPLSQTLSTYSFESLHHLESGSVRESQISLASMGHVHKAHDVLPVDRLLDAFSQRLHEYQELRDVPEAEATSGLSVHLRFGTLSIRALLRWLVEQKRSGVETEPLFRQLLFRDFYAMSLYHFPHLATENFRYTFNGIADDAKYRLFCEGMTGVPIVDAGIRELLETGRMHNRVRMIVASFFTKDLLLPWQWGEAFFAKHLLDYDAASNILSWQWSAGTGVDPQPYFRIFNPWLQAKKFDPQVHYIKRWLPALSSLEAKTIHDEASTRRQRIEGYPRPILMHKEAAKTALSLFRSQERI